MAFVLVNIKTDSEIDHQRIAASLHLLHVHTCGCSIGSAVVSRYPAGMTTWISVVDTPRGALRAVARTRLHGVESNEAIDPEVCKREGQLLIHWALELLQHWEL